MKNPQNYKKYYKHLTEITNDIIMTIKTMMEELNLSSIDLRDVESHCIIHDVDMNTQLIAIGLVKTPDDRIIVHYGYSGHEPEDSMDVLFLNNHTLVRLFKVFEEAVYEYPTKEFDL